MASPPHLTGLSDPRLARAIVAMHDAPGDAWRVDQLAQVAGMSRTSFAYGNAEQVPRGACIPTSGGLPRCKASPGHPASLRFAPCIPSRSRAHASAVTCSALPYLFRDLVGQTPADCLNQWRMGLAQAGLLQGASIKQLATELGYANASALSRAFAVKTGHSPRDWPSREAGPAAG